MPATMQYSSALIAGRLACNGSRGLPPRLVVVHADVRRVTGHAAACETRSLANYLADLSPPVSRRGAQIATIPAFALQVCAQELADLTPLPS